jgi:hypothetical protein
MRETRFVRVQRAREAVAAQRAWIERCGIDRAGYIANYGSADDPGHHGDGGEAIYAADRAELDRLEEELAAARGEAR